MNSNLLDIAQSIGLNPKYKSSTNGGEYCSSCPACGGNDRFLMWPNQPKDKCLGRYWCRKCGAKGDTIQFCMDFMDMSYPVACNQLDIPMKKKSPAQLCRVTKFGRSSSSETVPIKAPSEQWKKTAEAFVSRVHEQIWNYPRIRELLHNRGISDEVIKQFMIGYNPHCLWQPSSLWDLEREKDIWLPKGIVLPTFDGSEVKRLTTRRTDWKKGDTCGKYINIPGSMNGFNIVGDKQLKKMICVESLLDAFAVVSAVGNQAFAVAIGGSIKRPDLFTDHLAKESTLIICHDNDNVGKNVFKQWKDKYRHAIAAPVPEEQGKDVGEAISNGFDVTKWLKGFCNT